MRTSHDVFFCLFVCFILHKRDSLSGRIFNILSLICFLSLLLLLYNLESSTRVVLCDFLTEGLLTQLLASLQENVFYELVCKDFYCRHVRYVH